VQFWFNLLKAEKANWWDYVPGEFPDDVAAHGARPRTGSSEAARPARQHRCRA
jgi:hypothetical protein